MAPGSSAVYLWYQARKRGENLGDILSRIDLSDLESKTLEYSLESDFDAYGSGFLSVALTEEQEAEAKELYRVLFLVLQDPDALKILKNQE